MHLRDFARSGRPPTLFSASLYFDISFMVWVLIGALGVYIARDLGLTASQKGILVAIPILGGSLFRIAMGILTDRIGPKKTGMIRQLIVLLPLVWGWRFGNNLPQLMALGLLLGVALASFLAIFFHDQYGLSKVMAGNFTALCVFAGSMFRPLGGYLADRFGGLRMPKILFGVVGILMLGVGLLPPLAMVTVFLFVGMSCLGMGNGSVFQLVPQRFRQEIGVVTGIVGAAGGIGGFLLPSFLGIFKDLKGESHLDHGHQPCCLDARPRFGGKGVAPGGAGGSAGCLPPHRHDPFC
jgi:nitrate/nitrite transporter NarK